MRLNCSSTPVPAHRTVRPARPAEAGLLAAIDADASAKVGANPWSEQQYAAACGNTTGQRDTALVVEHNGNLEGFVLFSQVLDEASIHNIAVRAEEQGQGLGQLLLETAMTHMKRAGAARCLLEVRQSNANARRLYARNDFTLDGVRKNYYPTLIGGERGGREDALLMSRDL